VSHRFERVPFIQVELLGDVWAAFSPASGETVLLNDEAAAILEALETSATGNAAIIAETLAADCGLGVEDLDSHVSGALARLEKMGLVRPADEPNRGC